MDSLHSTVMGVFASLVFLYYAFVGRTNNTRSSNSTTEAPEPNGAWPIIGHLHLLGGGDQLLYRTLGAMADKYGPTFNIRLGSRRAFVVNSWEVARECFTINDKALATRPTTVAAKHMGYNYAVFGFAPYSPFWREMRKIATLELLSNRRLEMLKHFRASEVDMGIQELYRLWGQNGSRPVLVELKQWLEELTLDVVVRMVAGKRYFGAGAACDDGEARRCQKAISQFFHLIGIFVVSDAIPFLWWLDLQGHEKEMKKTAKELDSILGDWLEEHRRRRISGEAKPESEKDFIDVMLSLQEEGQLSNFQHDSDTSIKSTCLAIILGGSDTTAGTLTWAISLLLNNPDVLKRAQDELDLHVGVDRQVEESDMKNLVYLQAIIKETLRLYPAGPLLGPREAMDDCNVAGYNVKAGTRLIVNIWKLQRDPKVWENPSAFKPERFLTSHSHVDVRGQQFELMPFGSGRRSCPGVSFALQVLHLTFARLLHAFNLATPSDQPVDMTESPGLTIPKATPLEVLLTPRLSANLYGSPEPDGAWPIIGHLHLLGGSQLPHIALGAMADKYGPIFTLRLGVHRALVVSNWETAKELHTSYDVVMSSRPKYRAAKHLDYNYAMFGFSPYEICIKELYKVWSEKKNYSGRLLVEMKQWFGDLTLNVILKMIAGNRYFGATVAGDEAEARRCRKVIRALFHYLGLFLVSDMIPFLGWLDLGGHEKGMKETANEIDSIIGEWLKEHREMRNSAKDDDVQNDFIDVLLSAVEGTVNLSGFDADTIIKSTCSVRSFCFQYVWTRDELDAHVGKDRLVNESDINNLVYLQAVVKETFRLYPAAPLSGPREFAEDCTVGGFHVRKGTRLIMNLGKLQCDPKVWSNPAEFRPERFLTAHIDVDVKGQHFELIPLGAGRRSCPAAHFGLQMLHLVLATLLHSFELSTPVDAPVDMTESAGLTNMKATPLEVLLAPRLSPNVY
ncbi:hypothetical protein RJ639_024942 [Escallonia herrerae]|uniref:Cytochrome P450 n=1 Tax=Escallonia herrerae TaxID=1293975 RepID=A0AA88S636_9ASTE|nr:hypothetical protein RJ639_024942 [Escallonia herrerae]